MGDSIVIRNNRYYLFKGFVMRSTQKDIARLYREVRQAIGVRTNREASKHLAKALKHYTRKLSAHAIGCVMLLRNFKSKNTNS